MWDEIASETAMEDRLRGRTAPGGVWHEMCRHGAQIEKHYNTKESALAMIQKIIDIADKGGKAEPLFQTELKARQGRVVETSAGKELETQIQRSIKILEDEISKHFSERPPASFKKHKDAGNRKKWKEWQQRHRDLEQKLATKQQELKKLRNIVVSNSPMLMKGRMFFCLREWC